MYTLAPLVVALDEGYREFAIALNGLTDEDLWKRAHPRLLSVGELAGHIAYWEAVGALGAGNDRPDLQQLPITSPLLDHAFRYYTTTVDDSLALELGTAEVLLEVERIHKVTRSSFTDKEMDEPYPGSWRIWGNFVQYQVFHVAYHTGQAYSVRHLMGHLTEDN